MIFTLTTFEFCRDAKFQVLYCILYWFTLGREKFIMLNNVYNLVATNFCSFAPTNNSILFSAALLVIIIIIIINSLLALKVRVPEQDSSYT